MNGGIIIGVLFICISIGFLAALVCIGAARRAEKRMGTRNRTKRLREWD